MFYRLFQTNRAHTHTHRMGPTIQKCVVRRDAGYQDHGSISINITWLFSHFLFRIIFPASGENEKEIFFLTFIIFRKNLIFIPFRSFYLLLSLIFPKLRSIFGYFGNSAKNINVIACVYLKKG